MPSFAEQLASFSAKTQETANEVVREAIKDVGDRLVLRSPVDTGRFRSNWNYGLETRDAHTTEATNIIGLNNLEELPSKALGFNHFISNALPYGPALERGHSKQAPQGMVGLTAMEWPEIVASVVLRVKP